MCYYLNVHFQGQRVNYCPNTLQVFIGSYCLIVPNNTLGFNAELASSSIPTRNWLRCTNLNYCFCHMQYIFISSHCLLLPAKPKIWLFNKNQQNSEFKMQNVHTLPSTRLLIWMHERNTIKLHVKVSLKMNTWMFEHVEDIIKLKH